MNDQISDPDPLSLRLKQLIAGKFRLGEGKADSFSPDEALIGGRLGLDSLDALELGICVEEEFGITIGSAAESRLAFASIASLACFIRRQVPKRPLAGLVPRPLPPVFPPVRGCV